MDGKDFFSQVISIFTEDDAKSASSKKTSEDAVPHVSFDVDEQVDSFWERLKALSKKVLVVLAVLLLIALAFSYWWFHPALNIHNIDIWAPLAIFILVPSFLTLRRKARVYKKGKGSYVKDATKARLFSVASVVPAIVLLIGIFGLLASLVIFPGNAYRFSSLLSVEDVAFTEDIEEVNYNEIPVIDRGSAILLGNRTMGTMSDLVSQFEISSLYSQINYKDHPVRVSPLGYADLFKWLQNRTSGIPAYAIVDMTSQDARIVRLEEKDVIRYSTSEPLVRNIDRHVQLKYPTYMFGEKSFEIDDDGHAWWICPVRKFTIGLFGGETISRVVMVDATTGETKDVEVDEVPTWVDRVYPSDLLIKQYNWRGMFAGGWINSWLGQNGVVQTTPGTDGQLGYNYIAKDDDVWLYTGVTSATSDNSIVGFVLINQRTAETHYYSVAGATEDSAMRSAEGQVQNLRYEAAFPILINVSNTPTYFMALKDAAGLVKKYAMVDIERYQNVAVGDTVADTQKSYITLLATNGAAQSKDASEKERVEGAIETVATAVIEGNSHFYLTLKGDEHIYDCPLPGLIEVVGYKPGDTIVLAYTDGDPLRIVSEIGAKDSNEAESITE